MTDLKTSLFFTGFSITTPCILAYLASISYNMTWADAILIMGLTVIDLTKQAGSPPAQAGG